MYGFWPLLALAFLLVAMVATVRRARREREKTGYLLAITGLLGALLSLSLFLDQLLLALLLCVPGFPLSIVTMYKVSEVNKRRYARMVEEVDVSAPLRVRDFLSGSIERSGRSWLIMASRWGIRKTALLYYLFGVAVVGAVLSIASLFLHSLGMIEVVIYTIIVNILNATLFYRRITKSLDLHKGDSDEK